MHYKFDEIIPEDPSEVVFWTGAGISSDPPSNLPIGNDLTQKIVEHFCTKATWKKVKAYLGEAQKYDNNINNEPRLEVVLDRVVDILGYGILGSMQFWDAPPNNLHHFFAHHIKNKGCHITLNLDLCIENAIQQNFPNLKNQNLTPSKTPFNSQDFTPFILHVHDKFEPNNLQSLGLTFGT